MLVLVVSLAFFAVSSALARTTIKDEIELGKKLSAEIEKEFPVTDNKAWLEEIENLGNMLVPGVKRKEIPYSFKVIKEKVEGKNQIDAFSLPGGPVYFSERLWALLSRDERIGVLAHEIAHIDKRHAIDTLSEMQRRSLWTVAILIITGTKSKAVYDIADLANQIYTLKYSRKRETEADLMAVDLAVAAGESPVGLVTALKKIMRLERENGVSVPRILSTHPPTKDRVSYLTKRCGELGIKPEDMELKFEDQPDKLGEVTARTKKSDLIQVAVSRELAVGEKVLIKKPLWDEAVNALVPKTVAEGVVMTSGRNAQVSIKMVQGFEYEDIEQGDGV